MTKSNCSKSCDRLSELPDSLISHILGLLPMRYVVRTSILSKRWKNLWTTVPCLSFDNHRDEAADRVRNFVNRALMFWRGTKIRKFKIDFWSSVVPLLFSDIDLWVRFAMENEAQELCVHLGGYYKDELLWVPHYLYSSSSLQVLSLKCFNIQVNGNVQWNHLKSLSIDGQRGNQHLIGEVLSGSPQLEVFVLALKENGEDLSIRSGSLKRLSIKKYRDICWMDSEPLKDSELEIWSPNLETLEIYGVPYSKCSLMNFPCLTHATVGFCINKSHDLDSTTKFLEETLKQIFPAIQHAGNVTLSDWCVQVVGAMKNKDLLSPMANVKFLKLNAYLRESAEIAGLLMIFPKVERLVLEDADECSFFYSKEPLRFEVNLPESFLLQLKTVEVIWGWWWVGYCFPPLPFIQFVLRHASKLEKIVIRSKDASDTPYKAAEELLTMTRSFRTVDLIFRHY